jgi:prephenate dehydrogenase
LVQERWVNVFTRILNEKSHQITIYDLDKRKTKNLSEKYNCNVSDSIQDLAQNSDIIICCTPIRVTPQVINQVLNHTSPDTLLVEISSLKKKNVEILRQNKDKIRPLSVHPMFGPDIEGFEGNTIVVVPVVDEHSEIKQAKELFWGSNVIVADEDSHDQSMAFILSLPYFMNIVFAKCLPEDNLSLIRSLAGPTFKAQLALTQSIAGEDSVLIESLIDENVFAGDLINNFIDELKYLRRMLKSKPWMVSGYCDEIRDSLINDPGFETARDVRNKFIESNRV